MRSLTMPPRKEQDRNQKTLELSSPDEQPSWARNMESRLSARFDQVCESVSILETRIDRIETETDDRFKKFQSQMEEYEFHQRKYNLIFFGLKDELKPAETRVKEFLERDMEMTSAKNMLFQHCHPLPAQRDSTRPVIVRFVSFSDKEAVLRNLSRLKGKSCKVSVVTDLPKTMRDKRNELRKEMRAMKEKDGGRILRVAERGQAVRIEEKKAGKWCSVK